jgi:hypothetical protein
MSIESIIRDIQAKIEGKNGAKLALKVINALTRDQCEAVILGLAKQANNLREENENLTDEVSHLSTEMAGLKERARSSIRRDAFIKKIESFAEDEPSSISEPAREVRQLEQSIPPPSLTIACRRTAPPSPPPPPPPSTLPPLEWSWLPNLRRKKPARRARRLLQQQQPRLLPRRSSLPVQHGHHPGGKFYPTSPGTSRVFASAKQLTKLLLRTLHQSAPESLSRRSHQSAVPARDRA